ncbi:unnamed protein product [marine sediment metagenome]|uniref:Uncharacterized protein n=1 Tax=marine sediment metagenome TaxID=412755 RepID=X1LTB5_9ZZZZ
MGLWLVDIYNRLFGDLGLRIVIVIGVAFAVCLIGCLLKYEKK